MKIKPIVSLCKNSKTVRFYKNQNVQWIGDGFSMYPLNNMPELTKQLFCELYDISDKQAAKISFFDAEWPVKIKVEDSISDESQVEMLNINLVYGGKEYIPFKGEEGIFYIDRAYLGPISDLDYDMVYFFERGTDRFKYLVVKNGFNVIGVILPKDGIITSVFCAELMEIAELSNVRRSNLTKKEGNA